MPSSRSIKTVIKLWPMWLLVAAAFMVCNMLTPMMLDDCAYANSGHTLQAIVHTQHNAYLHSNGRVLAHGIAQLFCGILGKNVFNIVNSLMAALLTLLLFVFGNGHRSQSPWVVAAASAGLVWFALPDQPITLLLVAGSLNYLWASVVVLLFMAAMRHLNAAQRPWHHTAATVLLGFVAGAWGEMYAACLAPAMFVHALINRQWLNRRCTVAYVGFCIGAMLMLLAPGNWARMALEQNANPVPISTRAVNTIVGACKGALPWLWIATALLAIMARAKHGKNLFWHDNMLLLAATLVSLVFTTASGAAWPRTFFACYVFAIVMLLRQFEHLRLPRPATIALTAAICTAIAISLAVEVPHLQSQHQAMQHCLPSQPTNHYAVWTGGNGSHKTMGGAVLSVDANNWRNTSFYAYHNQPSRPVVPQQVAEYFNNTPPTSHKTYGDYLYVIIPQGNTPTAVELIFTTDTVWLYPSKLARLIDILGTNLHSQFTTNPTPLRRHTMKKQVGLRQTLKNTDDNDAFGLLQNRGQNMVFINKNAILFGINNIDSIQFIFDTI